MRFVGRIAALFLAIQPSAPVAAQTPAEQVQLDRAVQRGRMLYEIDRAAWVATDDMRGRIRDPGAAGIRGWTVERDAAAWSVTFYMGEGESRAAVYRARVENNRVVSHELFAAGARPALTAAQRRLADARAAVARLGQTPCTQAPFNAAVIPPDSPDGPLDVYALTAQTEAHVYPFGGHFLATLSPAGEIVSQRAFMRSCFNAELPRNRPRPEALMITHLLDPVPTEIHVFMSIWLGLPVYVGIEDRVWVVSGEGIRLNETPIAAPKN